MKMRARISAKSLLIIILILASTASIGILIYYLQPIIVEGVVDHKTLVGVKDDVVKTLLMVTPHGILIKDKSIKAYVSGDSILYERLIENLSKYYDRIYCTVSIRVSTEDPLNDLSPGETLAYIVDIKYSSLLEVGSRVKFVITRLDPIKISRIISIEK